MARTFGKIGLAAALAAVTACAVVLVTSPDPHYTAEEWLSLGRFDHYDPLIRDAARKHNVDPLLVKAVVWRESDFHPDKVGTSGERGLMQVGEAAAADWARINKVQTFTSTDLFSPGTNLEVGTWYLARALQRWSSKDDPIPFALAEYNAGKRRVDRWIERSKQGDAATSDDLWMHMDFPTTRAYIETITRRRSYYEKVGEK